jgi:hypothetical protein
MKQLPQDWIDKMSDSEKERYFAMTESRKKVKALAADILAECQRQGFTIEELGMLSRHLIADCENMIEKCKETTKVTLDFQKVSSNTQSETCQVLGKTHSTIQNAPT